MIDGSVVAIIGGSASVVGTVVSGVLFLSSRIGKIEGSVGRLGGEVKGLKDTSNAVLEAHDQRITRIEGDINHRSRKKKT